MSIGTRYRGEILCLVILAGALALNVGVAWFLRTRAKTNGNTPADGIAYATTDGRINAFEYSMRSGVTTRGLLRAPAVPSAPEVEPRTLPAWSIGARMLEHPRAMMAFEDVSGWPWRGLYARHLEGTTDSAWIIVRPEHTYVLPYGVAWPGFLANTAFYAIVLVLVGPGPFAVRRMRRRRRGACVHCGYDLRGAARCPECGREK